MSRSVAAQCPPHTGHLVRRAVRLCLFLCAAFIPSFVPAAGFEEIPLPVPAAGRAGFTLLSPQETGVAFTNTLSPENASANQIRLNGSGVALGDCDGDGRADIFFCSLEGRLSLYRNLGGWKFTNIAADAGLDLPGNFASGATLADVDGDQDLDLLVNGIGTGTRLFLNNGQGRFTEARESGLFRRFGATTSTLGDIDGNGTLDLYVANYRTNTVRTTGFALLNVEGKRMVMPKDRGQLEITPEGRVLEHGDPHLLYLNDGTGKFTALNWTTGRFLDEQGEPLKSMPHDWGLTAAFRDLNGDGHPDLYVCNDFHSPDRIWINDGRGRFRAIPRLALRHTATFSMSVDFADVDRDGLDDLLVSDMTSRIHGRRLMQIAGMDPYSIRPGVFDDRPQLDRTVLQWNRGDGTYAEIAHLAGLENSEWNWSVIFVDLDLDGYEDLLASTGHMFDTQDLDAQARIEAAGPYPREMIPKKLLKLPPLSEPKLAFRNRGNLTFEECGKLWGFDQVGVSHGMALADLDGDGDLDLVVNNLNAPAGIYRNESPRPRLAVRLKGLAPNTRGIGAKIRVEGGPVLQNQEMMCGGRYLSADDTLRVFAAGESSQRLRIQVTWRNGRSSLVEGAQPNHLYVIDESSAGPPRSKPTPAAVPPLFEDVTERLGHRHTEAPFDDFGRQPLLPRRLSQLGPGVAWWDMDGDGWEDLVIGAGRGGELGCWRNDGKGGFQRQPGMSVSLDNAGLAGWKPGVLLVATSNYEAAEGTPSTVSLLVAAKANSASFTHPPSSSTVLSNLNSSAGPLAVADYNGDGELDLFVGARVQPGRYPEAAKSALLLGENGVLKPDVSNTVSLGNAGLVSGALWSDLEGDGFPELVLACEWGAVRVFRNRQGVLKEATQEFGLGNHLGWWNGVNAGDFDGDGRLDLVASNWGRNTPHRASAEAPLRVYYTDFNQDGLFDVFETCFYEGREVPARDLEAISKGLPFVRQRFPSHASYGQATARALLGDTLDRAQRLQVTTLDSMLFLNRTSRFEARALPIAAQIAPAFAVCAGDADGDGHEDLFLSQNFFATEPKTPRCDAGRGLWLFGDGSGGFKVLPGGEAGVAVYGEQRGAALCDFDQDGRLDLVVAQNAAETRLFRNSGGRPGLRVRLSGPDGNPCGIGAVVRLEFARGAGPAHELHGGSGYWSQESAVIVMGQPEPAVAVWVRWPGGKTARVPVPAGAREVRVAY